MPKVQETVKLLPVVKAKLDKMSKLTHMPRSQCVNMLVTKWLKDND